MDISEIRKMTDEDIQKFADDMQWYVDHESNWFNKYIKKCNEKNTMKDKYEKIIDELIQALAEERRTTEDYVRECFKIGEKETE